ncbi:MAG TPA: hypothetical protein DHW82_02760 [Spirochaetia bacterium]|nr:MAG: hypothetical protein A2Y41_03725 [Spirochaetes bacterium GWB1_36_13]HCL55912.1 hypothetical protein [Spirochaetia bacterium]
MAILKNKKISVKLLFSHGIMFLVFLGIVIHVMVVLNQNKDNALVINLSGRQRMLSQKISKEICFYYSNHFSKEQIQKTVKLFESTLQVFIEGGMASKDAEFKDLVKIQALEGEGVQEGLRVIKMLWVGFHAHIEKVLAEKNPESFQYIAEKNGELLTALNKNTILLESIFEKEMTILYYEVFIGIGVFFLIFLFSLGISKSISRPLKELVGKFQKGAEGDLTSRIEVSSEDEIGQLGSNYNRFIDSLSSMIHQIFQNTEHFLMGISELAQGNQDLSQRVDSQSASLEETASAIEEMTANLKNTADNSNIAKKLTHETQQTAFEGEKSLEKMVSSMKNITEQTVKIKDIVKIIEGISFQTNILALNAAVEAARAKEHGKGFAVVANEVRTLAQKAAENSKQISDMIEGIVKGISEGNKQAGESQKKFLEIKNKIENTSASIQEVALATEEQANGVDQINLAVAHLDEITQNNASLVEEVAASSEELEKQTRDIIDLIQFFKIDTQRKSVSEAGDENILKKKDVFIIWDGKKYSVKVEKMDEHHQHLLGIMNELYVAIKNKKAKDVLLKLVTDLVEYTKYHFGAEETLMKQYSYPGLPEQKVQHQKFVEKISDAKEDLERGKALSLSTHLMTFLRDWFINHIMKIDGQYGDFFNKNGLK